MVEITEYSGGTGMHVRGFDASTKQPTEIGQWYKESGAETGTETLPKTIFAGYYGDTVLRKYTPSCMFRTLDIDQGGSIKSAKLQLYMQAAFFNIQFNVYHNADPNDPDPSASFSPEFNASGSSATFYNSDNDANSGVEGQWTPDEDPLEIDVKAHLQEMVNRSDWSNGGKIVFMIRPAAYEAAGSSSYSDDSDGAYAIRVGGNTGGSAPRLVYELTDVPTITNVDGDNAILADQQNVVITGTNLDRVHTVRIFKGNDSYAQPISTKTATTIEFNADGSTPTGTGYTLEVIVDQARASISIDVGDSSGASENVTEGTALTSVDGHEYVASDTGFPGTWETKASVASTGFYTDGIFVGKQNSNFYKASIKLGPVDVDKDADIYLAELNLNVVSNYKYNTLEINAVADPTAADISAANIISNQSLTTAQVVSNNAEWTNSSSTNFWVQSVNPKNIDVTTIVQEVVNHANWVTGSYIQFVVAHDQAVSAGIQGNTRLYTNDETGGNASTLYYIVDEGVTITSVSGNNIIELGELNCTIVGRNLGSASNLNINKGGISENQTIISNTAENIVFNVNTGAIVAGSGYTIQFDIDSVTYSKSVQFVEGGGVNVGTGDPDLDGYEDIITNTWYDEYAAQNVCIIGRTPFLSSETGTALSKIGPITAQQNQLFTTADLTWACDWSVGAYKTLTMRIQAVADPAAADVGTGNLPSDQTLTTAFVDINTNTFAGASSSSYWSPANDVIDITDVVEEVVGHSNWATGAYIQLVFSAPGLAGSASISFNSTESGSTLLSFDYVTGAATNVSSVNGSNEIRVNETGVTLSGNDLEDATEIRITDGTYTEIQAILSNTATLITFDFRQGKLGYTDGAIITLAYGNDDYSFIISLLPESGRDYVTLGTPSTGDNSLLYNESPEMVAGDIIDYQRTSSNGFNVTVSDAGVPTIEGGASEDTFTARGYFASTGTWCDAQLITFSPASYFIRNTVPMLQFSSILSTGTTAISDEGESWELQDDTDSGEGWS